MFETCHVFKLQYRNIKLDWIFGSEVKPWISGVITLDP